MSKKSKSPVPMLDLKGNDFMHSVPEEQNIELIVHWKHKNSQPEFINPVKAFAKQNGELKVINRNLPDTCYTFNIKEIKAVYIMPMEN